MVTHRCNVLKFRTYASCVLEQAKRVMFDPLVGFLIICFNLLYLANLAGRHPLLVGLKSPAIIKDVLGLSEISIS